jgi:hypothetical protein
MDNRPVKKILFADYIILIYNLFGKMKIASGIINQKYNNNHLFNDRFHTSSVTRFFRNQSLSYYLIAVINFSIIQSIYLYLSVYSQLFVNYFAIGYADFDLYSNSFLYCKTYFALCLISRYCSLFFSIRFY